MRRFENKEWKPGETVTILAEDEFYNCVFDDCKIICEHPEDLKFTDCKMYGAAADWALRMIHTLPDVNVNLKADAKQYNITIH